MYSKIIKNLDQIREQIGNCTGCRFWHQGLPTQAISSSEAHRVMPTLYYINAISTISDALKLYIETTYPELKKKEVDTLGKRIKKMEEKMIFSDMNSSNHSAKMRSFLKNRNKFAHEVGEYSSWEELGKALEDIDNELKHLKIIT